MSVWASLSTGFWLRLPHSCGIDDNLVVGSKVFDDFGVSFGGPGVASQFTDCVTVGVVKYDNSLESIDVGCGGLVLYHDGVAVACVAVLEEVEACESSYRRDW